MTKISIREFKLAASGGLNPYLNRHGAFVGQGTPLLAKDGGGSFVPLPRRELEAVLSAGYGMAVDLGSRMRGLSALAKALNEGDHALGAILLVQLQFPPLPDWEAAGRMQKAAAMLKNGDSGRQVLKRFLPEGELAKFNPYHLGPGPGGGQFTTPAAADGAGSGEAKPKGYVTKLSPEEILKRAKENGGWLWPKDADPANRKQCVSLVRAVIPELPHSSQWTAKESDRLTPESVKHLAPRTAIATFTNGRYGNAPTGNHAAIFLRADTRDGREGIVVLDQFEGRHRDPGEVKERFYPFEPSPDSNYLAGAFSVIQ